MGSSGRETTGYSPPHGLSLPSSYLTAIRYVNLNRNWLHQPLGRAVAIGDAIFYSPNSSFVPACPPPAEHQLFRDPAKDNVEELHQPRWWSSSAAYLPFLPTSPNLHSPPFHVLFNNPTTRRKNHVQMDPKAALEWANLEQRLKCSVQQFQSGYAIPVSHTVPIVATSLACQGMYQHPKQFSAAEKRSRNWFSLWMAIISFCVAVAQVVDDEDNSVRCPAWFRCLVRYVDERTASGLRQQLSQFTGAYTRAGIFLNLLEDNHTQQPTVEFYVRFGVPVWYHWGHREEALAQSNPEGFGRFVPPPHLLQTARSYLIKEPAVIPIIKVHPWEVFFQERKRRGENSGLAPRQKPTLKVFLWEQNSGGKWMRMLVRSKERQVILKQYGRRQKVFDERSNEWDCCEAMGNLDPDEEHWSDNDSILRNERRTGSSTHCEPHDLTAAFPAVSGESVRCYTRTPSPEPPSDSVSPSRSKELSVIAARSVLMTSSDDRRLTMSCTEMSTHCPSLSALPTQVNEDDHYLFQVYDPADILRLFYGFVFPPYSGNWFHSLPTYEKDGIEAQNLSKAIGIHNISSCYINSSVGQAAVNFFYSFTQKDFVPPRNEMYDLALDNISSVKKSPRLSYMRKLPGDVFIFVFKDTATVPWSIGVTSIMDAMFILRLDCQLDDYQIACQLLNLGVRFLTLLNLPAFPAVAAPTSIPRIRLSGYSFSVDDYDAYYHERDEMLRNPRVSRGALKRGGILWRLAVGTTSFHDVLSGPSIAVTISHQCMSLNPGDKFMWCDDSLDQTETDILCGVYHVFTGEFQKSVIYCSLLISHHKWL